ncbi:MAG: hypothetical protein KDB84_03440 [Flavobacteriales bacterium]|nr:hypothetical protein [Flavobacteriales bacterium]
MARSRRSGPSVMRHMGAADRMRRTGLVIVLMGTLVAAAAASPVVQDIADVMTVAAPDTIRFHRNGAGNLLIPAVLNGTDTLTLMFHTGMEGVAITSAARAWLTTFHLDGSAPVVSWGGRSEGEYSAHNLLRVGKRQLQDVSITVDERSGDGSDGKVGHDLFAGKVLEVDHDKALLIVHDRMPAHVPAHRALPLERMHGGLYIPATITTDTGRVELSFLLHTGYGGAVILCARAGYAVYDTLGVEVLHDSYGNELRNMRTSLPEFILGHHRFTEVPASVMDPRSSITANVIGNALLRRFDLFLDLRNDVAYFIPNTAMGAGW